MNKDRPITIGVLALQGAYEAHARMLRSLGVNVFLVRLPEQLSEVDGLIIPGGESTTFLKHLERNGFFESLETFVQTRPTFGTCAGTILMAREVSHPQQRSLNVLDIVVERNFYGRQNDSKILTSPTTLPGGPLETVYIRAPRIARVGSGIEVLAKRDEDPVLIRKGHLLAATFHPELSNDTRVHQYFLDMVRQQREIAA
jgi:pyridoxal 5'-phosphate synthase pdxT subunit